MKKTYIEPSVEVDGMEAETIICASQGNSPELLTSQGFLQHILMLQPSKQSFDRDAPCHTAGIGIGKQTVGGDECGYERLAHLCHLAESAHTAVEQGVVALCYLIIRRKSQNIVIFLCCFSFSSYLCRQNHNLL